MGKGCLEAFSDGVIAILITIMVLELRVPRGSDWSAIRTVLPVLFLYLLSFVFLAIYWKQPSSPAQPHRAGERSSVPVQE